MSNKEIEKIINQLTRGDSLLNLHACLYSKESLLELRNAIEEEVLRRNDKMHEFIEINKKYNDIIF
jgi:hypothetical protein